MLSLAAGLALDIHLVARLVLGDVRYGACVGGAVFAMLVGPWFVLPWVRRRGR